MTDFDFGDFNDVADMAGVFQRAQQQRTQQQTLEALHDLSNEFAKQNAMPQCPVCGGRLGGLAVKKCMHCQVDIEWISGRPYDTAGAKTARDELERRQREQVERQKLALELMQKSVPAMERAVEEFLLADMQEVSYLQITENRSGHSVQFTRPVGSPEDRTVTLTVQQSTFSACRGVLAKSGIKHPTMTLEVNDTKQLLSPVVTVFGAAGIEAPIDFSVHLERPQPKTNTGCLGMLLLPALWFLWDRMTDGAT